jgi:glycosyltransferase involved in cell wall biosynthesis
MSSFEVIYIDSNSFDNSIEKAKSYTAVNIYKLIGAYNAAIARNVGANFSNGSVLFFIDADMAINRSFLCEAWKKYDLSRSAITGNVILICGEVTINKGDWFSLIIGKSIWNSLKGMKSKYRKAQDLEFFFRLNRKKIVLQRIDSTIATHYSKNWVSAEEMLRCLFRGDSLYRGVLYRDYLFSPRLWKFVARNEYTSLLFISLLVLIVCGVASPLFSIAYFVVLILRVAVKKNLNSLDFLLRIVYYFLRDISVYFGFLFFYPSNKKNIQYEKIQ